MPARLTLCAGGVVASIVVAAYTPDTSKPTLGVPVRLTGVQVAVNRRKGGMIPFACRTSRTYRLSADGYVHSPALAYTLFDTRRRDQFSVFSRACRPAARSPTPSSLELKLVPSKLRTPRTSSREAIR